MGLTSFTSTNCDPSQEGHQTPLSSQGFDDEIVSSAYVNTNYRRNMQPCKKTQPRKLLNGYQASIGETKPKPTPPPPPVRVKIQTYGQDFMKSHGLPDRGGLLAHAEYTTNPGGPTQRAP
jgi:hypothetical protein